MNSSESHKDVVYVDATRFFKVVRIMNGQISFSRRAMTKLIEDNVPKGSAATIAALEARVAQLEGQKRSNVEDSKPKKSKKAKIVNESK
nr:unnamed protein product [Haemonchus contortus]